MTYDEKTCRLESSTGYIKNLTPIYGEYPVYNYPIYVPNRVVASYAEATKEEYEAYVAAEEEEKKKAATESNR